MKKLSLIILSIVTTATVFAQKRLNPNISNNTVVNYILTQNNHDSPMVLTFKSMGDPIKIDWKIDGYGSGSYTMPAQALQSGKGLKSTMPVPNKTTKLPNNQTVACISKDTYNEMLTTQLFEYDGLKFKVAQSDTQGFMLKGRAWDVTHAIAIDTTYEIWILKNPNFPLICKTKNSTHGIDVSLVSVQ